MTTKTLRQKTAFGPGVYRGKLLDRDTLKSYIDGTNKAIGAGVPVPLLLRHAKPEATDEETVQFANEEGVGWLARVDLEADGSIAWEAKNVPAVVADKIESGQLRFTSPEFRPHYECEKAGVYTGPIIRHFAFTPKPGNPHQGEIEVLALSEKCWQFTEEDYERPASEDEVDDEDKKYGAMAMSEASKGDNPPSFAVNEGLWEKAKAAAEKGDYKDKWAVVTHIYKKMGGKIGGSQHAEGEPPFKKKNKESEEHVDESSETTPAPQAGPPESPPPEEAPPKNPDMPPQTTDKTKLAAVLAGFSQKGIMLPSDFDFMREGAIDILLAALNTNIRTEQELEAELKSKQEESPPPVTESPMMFSEQELSALPEAVRKKVEAADKARKEAEKKAQQYAEKEAKTQNAAAKDKIIQRVSTAKIPPALRMQLLERMNAVDKAIQFAEGEEVASFTTEQVVKMVEGSLPPALQFLEKVVNQSTTPKVNKVGPDGKPIPVDSEQFFEEGEVGTITPERARQIVAENPYIAAQPKYNPKTTSQMIADEKQRHPINEFMRS